MRRVCVCVCFSLLLFSLSLVSSLLLRFDLVRAGFLSASLAVSTLPSLAVRHQHPHLLPSSRSPQTCSSLDRIQNLFNTLHRAPFLYTALSITRELAQRGSHRLYPRRRCPVLPACPSFPDLGVGNSGIVEPSRPTTLALTLASTRSPLCIVPPPLAIQTLGI